MIYTFNTRGNTLYPVMKNCFTLSDNDIYYTINYDFSLLIQRLKIKGIDYKKLKHALIPNQNKKKKEICFVIDSTLIDSCWYSYDVFKILIPILKTDKFSQSTFSILYGDYTNMLTKLDAQCVLKQMLHENLIKYNESKYELSDQYFLIYINGLTNNQIQEIAENMKLYKWFLGIIDVTYQSRFKSYLSHILIPLCIKCKNIIIEEHPIDFQDEENSNEVGYPFEENGFIFISINSDSYNSFLSYKIESEFPDKVDVSFSLNSLFPKFTSIDKLKLSVDEKWDYITGDCWNKRDILTTVGLDTITKDQFVCKVWEKICKNYIYNLDINDYNIRKFNVCLELPTINGRIRKTTLALKYFAKDGIIELLTIT